MTRDDIIRMAREAGFNVEQGFLLRVTGIDEDLERFAALVEAHVLAGQREKYTWGTPLLDAFLLAPKPGQLKDRGQE
jgi:hypothetical protein